jgi:hypothetical protein
MTTSTILADHFVSWLVLDEIHFVGALPLGHAGLEVDVVSESRQRDREKIILT